jgi:hypothetical protein
MNRPLLLSALLLLASPAGARVPRSAQPPSADAAPTDARPPDARPPDANPAAAAPARPDASRTGREEARDEASRDEEARDEEARDEEARDEAVTEADCLDLEEDRGRRDGDDDVWTEGGVLAPLRLEVPGEGRSVAGIELQGLAALTEADVRRIALSPPPGAVELTRASAFLTRLARTGLFARVEPRLRLADGGPAVLEVLIEEHPTVRQVRFEGLEEMTEDELLEELLEVPSGRDDGEKRGFRVHRHRGRWRADFGASRASRCESPRPPRALLARPDERGDAVLPGVVWRGVPEALERVASRLRREGYVLASLSATLDAAGALTVRVDEGRLEAVEVRGVDSAVEGRVREALGLAPGEVLLRSDAKRALQRLEAELPFLRVDDVEEGRAARSARYEERERGAGGERSWGPAAGPSRRARGGSRGPGSFWGFDFDFDGERGSGTLPEGLTLEGRTLVVHVAPRRAQPHGMFYPLHTQVTGLTPGVTAGLRLFDPLDRAHLLLDGGLFVPLALGGQEVVGDAAATERQRRAQWLASLRLQVSRLKVAELGLQVHDFVDTPDRWRLGWFDSSLYSALLNRPDAEYFRRTGFSAFATLRPLPGMLLGAEYRRDFHGALAPLSPALSLFNRDQAFPNFAAERGRMASVVGRLEYQSDAEGRSEVGSLFRRPETSLFAQGGDWRDEEVALRALATLEVADPRLGGDAAFDFWKLVADAALHVPVAGDHGLRLRARVAGGEGLPVQKREALGGWSGVRGYGFGELTGTASALLSAEYRWNFLGAFADVGAVRPFGGTSWTEPKVGVGGALHFGEQVHLALAWRADGRSAVPEARLLFQRPF